MEPSGVVDSIRVHNITLASKVVKEVLPRVFYFPKIIEKQDQLLLTQLTLDLARHYTPLQVKGDATLYSEILAQPLSASEQPIFSSLPRAIVSLANQVVSDRSTLPTEIEFNYLTGYSYTAKGKLASHCDSVRGWLVLVSLGCTAEFFLRSGVQGDPVAVEFESGDALMFRTDAKEAIYHGVRSIRSDIPSHLRGVLPSGSPTRLSLQFRESLQKESFSTISPMPAISLKSKRPDIPGVNESTLCLAIQPWIKQLSAQPPALATAASNGEIIELPTDISTVLIDVIMRFFSTKLLSTLALTSRAFYAWINFSSDAVAIIKTRIYQIIEPFSSSAAKATPPPAAPNVKGSRFVPEPQVFNIFQPHLLTSTPIKHLYALENTPVDKYGYSTSASDGVTIVNLCGASTFQGGMAVCDLPSTIIPAITCQERGSTAPRKPICVGWPARALSLTNPDAIVGKYKNNGLDFEFVKPIVDGKLHNIDALVDLWEESQLSVLRLNPAAYRMLHCVRDAPTLDKPGALAAIQAAFERMGVFAYYHSSLDTLAVYSASKTTGVAVDLGGSSARVACVYEGYGLPQAVINLDATSGGDHLTRLTQDVLTRTYPHLAQYFDFNIAEYIKAKMTSTFHLRMGDSTEQVDIALSSEWLELGNKFIRPDPAAPSLAEAIYDSVCKCDPVIRGELFQNIILAGGAAQIRGLAPRLTRDLAELTESMGVKPKITCNSAAPYCAWQGASILGSLSTFPSMFITRIEYEEYGADIVFRKCF